MREERGLVREEEEGSGVGGSGRACTFMSCGGSIIITRQKEKCKDPTT